MEQDHVVETLTSAKHDEAIVGLRFIFRKRWFMWKDAVCFRKGSIQQTEAGIRCYPDPNYDSSNTYRKEVAIPYEKIIKIIPY